MGVEPIGRPGPFDPEGLTQKEERERLEQERREDIERRFPTAEQTRLRLEREREAKLAAENAAMAQELAPLRKGLMEELDFLGKRFGIGSKIGGRGLF